MQDACACVQKDSDEHRPGAARNTLSERSSGHGSFSALCLRFSHGMESASVVWRGWWISDCDGIILIAGELPLPGFSYCTT